MRTRVIAYWLTTGLLTLVLVTGGLADALQLPEAVAGLQHLGYPAYFGVLLGVWKLLGAATLVAPRLPRLKEWAYAGAFFDMTAATVSHAASGDEAWHALIPAVLAGVVIASAFLRPASRMLKT